MRNANARAAAGATILALLAPSGCRACSFLIASFDISADQLLTANRLNSKRGPDVTNVLHAQGWTFVHNLLSITGPPTLQPFVAGDGKPQVAVFNGEIYNYHDLAVELVHNRSAYSSDGKAILPAYNRWGSEFARQLHGEWSIIVVDFERNSITLSTDAFRTKPLWWATWTVQGDVRFAAASAKSALLQLGAPLRALSFAAFNEITVLQMLPAQQPAFSIVARLNL
eukprot:5157573-Prymnesium_polylepis.1